jgi:hypothetical protein
LIALSDSINTMQLRTEQLKTLVAVISNMFVPGVGFILAGYYRIGISIQVFLAGVVIILCWSRWILTPTGCKSLLLLTAAIYFLNTLFLIIRTSKNIPILTIKNILFAILFSITCIAALALGFITKDQWLGVHIYFVPSGSMQPTLLPGDFILVDHWQYPRHSVALEDVIVFKLPRHNELAVKRVKPWPDKAITHGEQFYMLGDNKRRSLDSRSFGGIEPACIQGKVVMILFSFDNKWKLRKQRTFKIID